MGLYLYFKVLVNAITPEISINIRFDQIFNQVPSRYLNSILHVLYMENDFHHAHKSSRASTITYYIKFYFSRLSIMAFYKVLSSLFFLLYFHCNNYEKEHIFSQDSWSLGGVLLGEEYFKRYLKLRWKGTGSLFPTSDNGKNDLPYLALPL